MNYKLTFFRTVNDKVRYYSLCLYPTLFGEYLLVREYGGVKNKGATRSLKDYFTTFEDALAFRGNVITKKLKRGYI